MALDSPAYRALRAELRDVWTAQQAPCWVCAQPIDYLAPAHDPEALDVDHVKPRSTHPHLELDRNNCRPSHVRCNRSRGNRPPRPAIGTVTEQW
ncbi:HNH endonuclease [Agrococcus casei]|uniref:HNH endonuclease n=1 Tax=Agrococcus casei TaxID=343512 RepID=UPI000B34D35E